MKRCHALAGSCGSTSGCAGCSVIQATESSSPTTGAMRQDIANRHGQAVKVIPTQAYTADRAKRAYIVDLRQPRSNVAGPRVANASMIMTYDRNPVVQHAGRVSASTLVAIDRALRIHLSLEAP